MKRMMGGRGLENFQVEEAINNIQDIAGACSPYIYNMGR